MVGAALILASGLILTLVAPAIEVGAAARATHTTAGVPSGWYADPENAGQVPLRVIDELDQKKTVAARSPISVRRAALRRAHDPLRARCPTAHR